MQYTIYNAFWNFHFLRSTYVWQKQFRGGWKMHFNHLFIHFAVALFHRHCFHPSYFVNHAGVENVGSLPYTSFSINSNSFQCFFPLKMASNLWAESKHFPRWNGAPLVLGNWMSALILGSKKGVDRFTLDYNTISGKVDKVALSWEFHISWIQHNRCINPIETINTINLYR